MYNILVVDDESRIRTIIRKYAEFEGHKVTEAGDGMEAVLRCREGGYDIVIMDIMMPELDGFSACREIRKSSDVPIIMLSARGEEYDKINGFGLGIDDYVVKPFSPKELMARIKAVSERNRRSVHSTFRYEDLVVDFDARDVFIDNERVNMTPRELDLLIYFIEHKNMALDRDKILSAVWDDYYGDERTVDTHVKMLRKSLGKYRDLIKTVRGMGYKLEI